RINDATKHASEALDLFQKRDDPRGVTEMKLLRSTIACDVGDWDGAASALNGLNTDSVANEEQTSILAWRRGEIAFGRGDLKAALAGADEAIAGAQKAHSFGTELSARLLRARALSRKRNTSTEAARELASVRTGVARYASVPLRLALAETELVVAPNKGAAIYREARALLARLPAYGRAFRIHTLGVDALRRTGGEGIDDALRAVNASYASLHDSTPAAQRAALADLAASTGLKPTVVP
ncbi:MAG: hypothetical protein ABIW82_16060, partial [Dokdonella sp.]